MAKVKATFYLPLEDNNGRDLSSEIAEVENLCFVAFDGWTLVGYFKGAWRMQTGEQSVDKSVVYHVILEKEQLYLLEQMLLKFKKKANQEAMYLEIEHQVDIRFI